MCKKVKGASGCDADNTKKVLFCMEGVRLIITLTEKVTKLFLETRFDAAMEEMNDAIKNIQLCASFRVNGLGGYHSERQDQEIAALVPSEGHTSATVVYPYIHLPYDNQKQFVGRKDELHKITSALSRDKTSEQRSFTIWGLGGIGKSQIALAFANRSKTDFDILLWINAATEESLLQSFTDVAIGLRLEGASRGQGVSNHGLVQTWFLLCGWLNTSIQVAQMKHLISAQERSGLSFLTTSRISQC